MASRRRLFVFSTLTFIIFTILCIFYYHRHGSTQFSATFQSQEALAQPTVSNPPARPIKPHPPHRYTHSRPTTSPKILLVSAFFPLSKSKHSLSDYTSWLSNFLLRIETPIYFYAPPGVESLVRSLRAQSAWPIYVNTTFEHAFDVPPLSAEGMREAYEEMHGKDREGFRHSPELYSIWNAKPFFLNAALGHIGQYQGSNPELSQLAASGPYDYSFWVDAGSFRNEHFYAGWPDGARVDEVFEEGSRVSGLHKEELIFFPICEVPAPGWRWWRESDGPVDFDFSEGSFFGGSTSAIAWYASTFYAQHNKYLSDGHFVGKDQTLINAIMFLHAKKFIGVWSEQPVMATHPPSNESPPSPDSSQLHLPLLSTLPTQIFVPPQSLTPSYCGQQWYYYEFFLSSTHERSKMLRLWSQVLDARGKEKPWWRRGWWLPWRMLGSMGTEQEIWERPVDGSVCRLREVVSVEGILMVQFGVGWVPRRMA